MEQNRHLAREGKCLHFEHRFLTAYESIRRGVVVTPPPTLPTPGPKTSRRRNYYNTYYVLLGRLSRRCRCCAVPAPAPPLGLSIVRSFFCASGPSGRRDGGDATARRDRPSTQPARGREMSGGKTSRRSVGKKRRGGGGKNSRTRPDTRRRRPAELSRVLEN